MGRTVSQQVMETRASRTANIAIGESESGLHAEANFGLDRLLARQWSSVTRTYLS